MSTEQQWKMLECAAKACGIDLEFRVLMWSDGSTYPCYEDKDSVSLYAGHVPVIKWNPLTNPADTAEMCAELRISVLYEHDPCEFLACFAHNSHDPEIAHYKDHDNSRLKAWMYAATMVAATLGGYKNEN